MPGDRVSRDEPMTDLDTYLKRHYRTADQLAAACAIRTDALMALVEENLVPAPSYVVTADGDLLSVAFGRFSAPGSTPGRYFHPGNAAWIALAVNARAQDGAVAAHAALKRRFTRNFAIALAELNGRLFRLPDSFSDAGIPIPAGVQARTESAWTSFLAGIFSLCVADPSSEASIARKEILQEALTAMVRTGLPAGSLGQARERILALVDQYAQAAMPFSPLEYPRSSRKRLVEDLLTALG
jgi:Family of unknown function (DUF6058)